MKTENLPILPEAEGHAARMTDDEEFTLLEPADDRQPHKLKFNDILFILLRRKRLIIICTLLGIAGGAAFYLCFPPVYESKAKLLVRYVVDRSTVDNLDSSAKPIGSQTDNLMNSEVEILTSLDLADQVAETVGIKRLLGNSAHDATKDEAARALTKGLSVTSLKGSNIISISYKNRDPQLATQVLEQLVKFYFDKHLEVHRSLGSFDLVARQTAQLRTELSQTEQELQKLKETAGITSPTEDISAVANELTKTQGELDSAETELAAQQARVREFGEWNTGTPAKSSSDNESPQPSTAVIEEYRSLVSRVAQLRQTETELLSRYTPQNRTVKVKQAQIEELEKQRRGFEQKYPNILAAVPATTSGEGGERTDLVSERAKLVGIQAQTEMLRSRLSTLKDRSKVLAEYGPRIEQLQRTKGVQEANYKYLEASLEKARIDETLDPTRMPNISVVQTPSPAVKASENLGKIAAGIAGAGLFLGIMIASLIELVFDRTVKRSHELEARLRVPLLLTIPYFNASSQRLRLQNSSESNLEDAEGSEIVQMENGDLLRPFCEAIRDRLGLFFDLNHMAHKPKLVAVTGLAQNAGASTLAAGLANALSDGTDGKVVLVDKPPATRRFYNMLMEFKSSDMDYIVFDMPSLGDTSSTLPLAGFMDTVLLVVEAERSNREAVKRAYEQLAAKTKVSVVFNKSRSYVPRWLGGEI
jgi:polysaccharide biosynthesis transport protein